MIRSGLLANYIIAVYNTIVFLLRILPRDSLSDTIRCVRLFGLHLAPISYIYGPINGLLLFIILSDISPICGTKILQTLLVRSFCRHIVGKYREKRLCLI